MPPLPPILLWTAGVVGAIALVRLISRERRRVNDELATLRMASAADKAERERHSTLKRDPRTGVYRP